MSEVFQESEEKREMMSNKKRLSTGGKEISHPHFAAFYTWMMKLPVIQQGLAPLRRETAGQAHGLVLEVGAGGGQNFLFYEKNRVEQVEAVEPDEAMLAEARRNQERASVPLHLTRALVEALPFPDAYFDSVVVTFVLCSVHDPERSLREIWRVLKPGGGLLLLEHVRAQGRIASGIQDALVPLTTRCLGECHWNRDTGATVREVGFEVTHVRKEGGGLQPLLLLQARRNATPEQMEAVKPLSERIETTFTHSL